ncbi:MAG: hypothetical protein HYX51_04415 [Chloroflexi bacterium]|nr:hypothetical protein [Chloroflexota bacterium]
MRRHAIAIQMGGRHLRRHQWSPGSVAIALVIGTVVAVLAVLLLLAALAAAMLAAVAYAGYRGLRAALTRETLVREAPSATSRPVRRADREVRGLLEMARTPDPLDRYLLAVREFDRISGALLSIDPSELGRKSQGRRAADLADQAYNLHDAITEIERQAAADPHADRALASIWELSVAAGDLWSYSRELRDVRRQPTLEDLRRFTSRRTALLTRRDALVVRLRDADLRRAEPLPPAAVTAS